MNFLPSYRQNVQACPSQTRSTKCSSEETKTVGKHLKLDEMQGDHIVPWSKGGKTLPDNLQMLCALCNQQKGGALA